ncbi:hapless 2-like isoform X3 [Oscarella lobularis]|uniref:hapless 2-like isoform X3 n=1 Tax=Oscarella lobularis TaxID=121494 RepID=UPI0033139457
MSVMKSVSLFLPFLILFPFGSGTFLAKSRLMKCRDDGKTPNPVNGKGAHCQSKLVVTLTVRSGQGNTESLHADVKAVRDSEGKARSLKKPFRIFMGKSPVDVTFPLVYEKSVPSEYFEHSHFAGRANIGMCSDKWKDKKASCRFAYDHKKEKIWASQGFCCRCTDNMSSGVKKWYTRGREGKCKFWGKRSSAHCLRFGQLWYNAYRLLPPVLDFNITFTLLTFLGMELDTKSGRVVASWSRPKHVTVSPTYPNGDKTDPRIVAHYVGDLLPSKFFGDLTNKYLFVPSMHDPYGKMMDSSNKLKESEFLRHKQVKNGMREWLLVDKHLVDFSGLTCNRIGLYYEGFASQPGKCRRKKGSCTRVTLTSMWETDHEYKKAKKTGKYFVENFGKFSRRYSESRILKPGSVVSLSFESPALHSSVVTLDVAADDVHFILNQAQGKIVEAYVEDFTALSKDGKMIVLIINKGHVSADFQVSVSECSTGIAKIMAQIKTINPGMSIKFIFQIWHHVSLATNNTCTVTLFDSGGNKMDKVVVSFSTLAACYCTGHCPCKCDLACEVEARERILNITGAAKKCDTKIYCELKAFFDRFLSKWWGRLILTIVVLLVMGLLKMWIEKAFCEHTDVDGIILALFEDRKESVEDQARMKFAFGACFFVYVPLLPFIWAASRMFQMWESRRDIVEESERQRLRDNE